jgi:hypothetical protein
MQKLFIGLAILGALLGIVWAIQGNSFFLYKAFAPKYEQVRRETFEQSKAYNQGVAQELDNEFFQYQRADSAGRAALAPVILHQVADYPVDKLPAHLSEFVAELRRQQAVSR